MLIQATQLRPGMILEYNGGLWRVMTINHITPGNWRIDCGPRRILALRGFVRVKRLETVIDPN